MLDVCLPLGPAVGVGDSRMLEWLTATGKKKRKSKGLSGGAYLHVISKGLSGGAYLHVI